MVSEALKAASASGKATEAKINDGEIGPVDVDSSQSNFEKRLMHAPSPHCSLCHFNGPIIEAE